MNRFDAYTKNTIEKKIENRIDNEHERMQKHLKKARDEKTPEHWNCGHRADLTEIEQALIHRERAAALADLIAEFKETEVIRKND